MANSKRSGGLTRRDVLATGAAAAAAVPLLGAAPPQAQPPVRRRGRINHSVCKWCYGGISTEQLARACVRLGIRSIELVRPNEWPILQRHGLICAMTPSHGIGRGLNDPRNHESCLAAIRQSIEATAQARFPNVICFSGNRRQGLSDEEGLRNCAQALRQIVGFADQHNVTLCMEVLNSRVNHRGYMCDKTAWAFRLVDAVGSPRFKILHDIYHVQIMEGDIIRTIRGNIDKIGHFHTGGNPGRHEIDETQELYYPAIMRAIADAGFRGYVGQEFVPRNPDKLASLARAIEICDV